MTVTKIDLEKDITAIIGEIIGISANEINPEALFTDDLGLDSLRALEILAAIENKFQIEIDPTKLQEMTCLNNVINITKEYLSN